MKDDRVLLSHIREEIAFLTRISTDRHYEDLLNDEYFAHAVIRAVEVMVKPSKTCQNPSRTIILKSRGGKLPA